MMRHSLQTFVSLSAAILFLSVSASAAEPVRLRVLSYNIHHAEGVDRKLDVERIAGVILSVKPDLVMLQEVDRNVKRTGGVDQPAELARLTNMQVTFGANIELQGGQYGNAVLSRFPIVRQENHHLPNVDNGEQRGVLAVEVSIPDVADSLLLFATHFDHRSNDKERVLSAAAVNALVEKSDRPALLTGDLNDVIGSQTLIALDRVWKRSNDEPLPTIPVAQPNRQIDFVLVRPASRWKVIETRVLDEAVASDHRAFLTVLELQPR